MAVTPKPDGSFIENVNLIASHIRATDDSVYKDIQLAIDLAVGWAIKPYHVEVDPDFYPGKYSSYSYAVDASMFADNAQTSADDAAASAQIAVDAAISAGDDAASAGNSANRSAQSEWNSEASRRTSESYAVETPGPVNIHTSNGDGTYTVTPTIDDSSYTWAKKAENIVTTAGMNWQNEWSAGEYLPHDVVRDGNWTMYANKTTTDRPAPQPINEPSFLLPDEPVWTPVIAGGTVVKYGYDFSNAGHWLAHTVRVWIYDDTTTYTGKLYNIDVPSSHKLLWDSEIIASSPGWAELPQEIGAFLKDGGKFRLEVTAVDSAANVRYVSNPDGLIPFQSSFAIKGFVTTDVNNTDPATTDDYYGIDIKAEEFTISDDWEVVALSGGLSGGSGGGASVFTELADTPNDYVGHAGEMLAVSADETSLEFVSPLGCTRAIGWTVLDDGTPGGGGGGSGSETEYNPDLVIDIEDGGTDYGADGDGLGDISCTGDGSVECLPITEVVNTDNGDGTSTTTVESGDTTYEVTAPDDTRFRDAFPPGENSIFFVVSPANVKIYKVVDGKKILIMIIPVKTDENALIFIAERRLVIEQYYTGYGSTVDDGQPLGSLVQSGSKVHAFFEVDGGSTRLNGYEMDVIPTHILTDGVQYEVKADVNDAAPFDAYIKPAGGSWSLYGTFNNIT